MGHEALFFRMFVCLCGCVHVCIHVRIKVEALLTGLPLTSGYYYYFSQVLTSHVVKNMLCSTKKNLAGMVLTCPPSQYHHGEEYRCIAESEW